MNDKKEYLYGLLIRLRFEGQKIPRGGCPYFGETREPGQKTYQVSNQEIFDFYQDYTQVSFSPASPELKKCLTDYSDQYIVLYKKGAGKSSEIFKREAPGLVETLLIYADYRNGFWKLPEGAVIEYFQSCIERMACIQEIQANQFLNINL